MVGIFLDPAQKLLQIDTGNEDTSHPVVYHSGGNSRTLPRLVERFSFEHTDVTGKDLFSACGGFIGREELLSQETLLGLELGSDSFFREADIVLPSLDGLGLKGRGFGHHATQGRESSK
jgi:hypothetical protein